MILSNNKKPSRMALPKIKKPVLAIGGELDFIASHVFYDILDDYCTDWEKNCNPWLWTLVTTREAKGIKYNNGELVT